MAKKIFKYNLSFRASDILVENGGVKSKWKFNYDLRKWNQSKWNEHWKTCGKVRKWKCANRK